MKIQFLIKHLCAAALAIMPARGSVIVDLLADGPAGPAEASQEFPSQAWGRASTSTLFGPVASVFEGLPPCCIDTAGPLDALAIAKVDATRGLAGAIASANPQGEGQSSIARAAGTINDILIFQAAPRVTIDMELSGLISGSLTGDAQGEASFWMFLQLEVDDPSTPFADIPYLGQIVIHRGSDGRVRWISGAVVLRVDHIRVDHIMEGTCPQDGVCDPPLDFSETFLLPNSALGLPVNLTMGVVADATCSEYSAGNCSLTAQTFDTGYVGITGDYTSTHSYPGRQAEAVPEPRTFLLVGLGLAAVVRLQRRISVYR